MAWSLCRAQLSSFHWSACAGDHAGRPAESRVKGQEVVNKAHQATVSRCSSWDFWREKRTRQKIIPDTIEKPFYLTLMTTKPMVGWRNISLCCLCQRNWESFFTWIFFTPWRTAAQKELSFPHNAADHWGPIGPHCQLPTVPLQCPIILVYTQHQTPAIITCYLLKVI